MAIAGLRSGLVSETVFVRCFCRNATGAPANSARPCNRPTGYRPTALRPGETDRFSQRSTTPKLSRGCKKPQKVNWPSWGVSTTTIPGCLGCGQFVDIRHVSRFILSAYISGEKTRSRALLGQVVDLNDFFACL
nr:hypothetical protein [Pandoravirus aubagnensis]